jgi:dienelactone hydrolase
MSDQAQPRAAVAARPVVYRMPCMDQAIRRQDGGLDLYYPPGWQPSAAPLPAVVFVIGYPDAGTRRVIGCSAREMTSFIDWAKLVASFGMVAVTYAPEQPERDAVGVIRQVRAEAALLGIDATRIGVWACSGHVPVALSLLMSGETGLRCAALLYGYLLDAAEAAVTFRFVNASAGRSVEDLPRDLPLLLVRAGRDEMPGVNAGIDAFVAQALRANLPLTLINHHTAPHAFDIAESGDDIEASRLTVMRTLAFLQLNLRPGVMPVREEKVRVDA